MTSNNNHLLRNSLASMIHLDCPPWECRAYFSIAFIDQLSQNILLNRPYLRDVDGPLCKSSMLWSADYKRTIGSTNITHVVKWNRFQFKNRFLLPVFLTIKIRTGPTSPLLHLHSLESTLHHGPACNSPQNMCICAPGSSISPQSFDMAFMLAKAKMWWMGFS